MKEKYINNYFEFQEKYKYQYGDFITNGYSILKIGIESLEKKEDLINKLNEYYKHFLNDYKYCYKILKKDINFKDKYIEINPKLINASNYDINDFSISTKELKKITRLIKIDELIIKENIDNFNSIVIELRKNEEIVGYLLPCKVY